MENHTLYNLIQAMDQGELRHCRKALQMLTLGDAPHKHAKHHLLIFETMAAMKDYDPDRLAKALQGTEILKVLAVEKARLKEILVSQLAALHDSRKTSVVAWKYCREAKVYLELGLYDAAAEIAMAGLKDAIKGEQLFCEVQLRELLREIYKGLDRKQYREQIADNEYKAEMAVEKLSTLISLTHARDRMLDHHKRYRVSDSEKVANGMEEIMSSEQMHYKMATDSTPARILWHSANSLYSTSRKDPDKAASHLESMVKEWESNQTLLGLYPHLYRRTLANLIGKLTVVGRTDEIEFYLNKMQNVDAVGRRAEILKFCDIELQYQMYYLNTGRPNEVVNRADGLKKGIRKYGKALPNDFAVTLRYNLGVAYLLIDEEGKAQACFSEIRDLKNINVRYDLQGAARLLRLLILVESDTPRGFGYFLRNSKSFFTKNDKLYSMEQMVYDWLRQHYKLKAAEKVESLKSLSERIIPYRNDRFTGADEIEVWARSKVTGKTIHELYLQSVSVS